MKERQKLALAGRRMRQEERFVDGAKGGTE